MTVVAGERTQRRVRGPPNLSWKKVCQIAAVSVVARPAVSVQYSIV